MTYSTTNVVSEVCIGSAIRGVFPSNVPLAMTFWVRVSSRGRG